jgi:hypothetical protein
MAQGHHQRVIVHFSISCLMVVAKEESLIYMILCRRGAEDAEKSQ